MPLNKLENFIKNTEGRILYVNPSDLDSTDAIENQGNSLTKPFKTIQRALLEAARFSYVSGTDNDLVEKTTILLFPGEHVVDNRPGYAIKDVSGTATAVSPSGAETAAVTELSLASDSIFDLTQSNNILYKFNSIHGGIVVPRGTSIVGLDLRKTKIRPKYVPNPTDSEVNESAIFRVTGACYFWQFSIFDGDQSGLVYTDSSNFSSVNQSKPTFSHHKLTCFEYADGVTIPPGYSITDLDMYYSKLSNAFNAQTGRNIAQKWPENPLGFSKKRPEWEIVGAFATDPITIVDIISGDGVTASSVITVTTETPHGLSVDTPIKIKGVSVRDYNVSTTVQSVSSSTTFTYLLQNVRFDLSANPSASSATVTVETDTVQGASPYIFNISMRSVWGMNGMHADGAKASGFRSMVVAQFTAVSLQKDDRAFVEYNKSSRSYEGISVSKVTGSALSSGSASTQTDKVYHLNPNAVYRSGWEISHIKASNDAFVQVVSVFAIGFTFHFDGRDGADYSITNSNSNFGQISLNAQGFKKEAFDKDDRGYITSVITPKAITSSSEKIDWVQLDVEKTLNVGISSHLYLFGYDNVDIQPPILVQGYKVGAKLNDTLSVVAAGTTYSANIHMVDNEISTTSTTVATGTDTSVKEYEVSNVSSNILSIGSHGLQTGERVIVISDSGNISENLIAHRVYYVIRHSNTAIKLASSLTNAQNGVEIILYGGTSLRVLSRVTDKKSGDVGSPIQYDAGNGNWYIHSSHNNAIYNAFNTLGTGTLGVDSQLTYIERIADTRSLDEKLYKLRVVIPKELSNSKDPEEGFVIQESSTTGERTDSDFTATTIDSTDYAFNRNPRFITKCSTSGGDTVTVITDQPHNLEVGENVTIKNVTCTENTEGTENLGYNGTFTVSSIVDDKTFRYSTTDLVGVVHSTGTFTNDINTRSTSLPRFERNDWKGNFYIYRNDVIQPHIENTQDGVYHLYVLNASNSIDNQFTTYHYSQNVADLYPQLDRDNINDNPQSASTYAKRSPIGEVVTSDLKKSLTRETIDNIIPKLGVGLKIVGSTATSASVRTLTLSGEHNLNGIVLHNSSSSGSGYTPSSGTATYYNVKLFNEGTSTWDGATANITVTNGSVTNFDIASGGSGYEDGEVLEPDISVIGSGSGAQITIASSGISRSVGNTVQITGDGTSQDGYYRIVDIPSKNQVSIAVTAGDPETVSGQYLLNIAPEVVVSSSSYTSSTGLTVFTTSDSHGFVVGNRLTVKNISDVNLGNYIVTDVTSTTITVKTDVPLSSPEYLLKHGLSSNDRTSDIDGENLGARGFSFYDNEILILGSNISNDTSIHVSVPNSGISTTARFPLGSYIQVDNEIMRITSSTLSGSGNNEISVIRGSLGTVKENHTSGALIKKILPKAIEFRRPTYLRASGHTFEYLGYGPGNYSTSLPQIQVRTLSEKEDYLAQAQEKNCGIVVYTGMNSVGDFFIGNKKINSSTGKEVVFDIPVPTIAGEDPSSLSVVFDEVIVKERILVEGGNSGTVLSQFDGPVKFNHTVKINETTTLDGVLRINNTTQSSSIGDGSVVVAGGVGIAKNLYVGGNLNISPSSIISSSGGTFGNINIGITNDNTINTSSGNLILDSATDLLVINASTNVGGDISISGDTSITGNTDITGNVAIDGELTVTGDITAFYTSDERLKDNVTPIDDPLAKVLSISGNTYDWNKTSGKEGHDVGVIAQEVLKVLPEAVTTRDNGYLAVDYQRIVPLLVEAIKELSAKVENLENNH